MRKFDCNCFAGNWPFHYNRCNTPQKLQQLHLQAGITGGLISSFEAIFYRDPWEADARLLDSLAGTPYVCAQTINPRHPGWEGMLRRGKDAGVRAVRIYPGFHGYQLDDPALGELCAAIREAKLSLVVTLRLEDARITHMIHPAPVTTEYLEEYLYRETGIPTLLTNIEPYEIGVLLAQIRARGDVWADISGFRSGQFAIEKQEAGGAADCLVYGSCAPLYSMMSTHCILDLDPCSRALKDRIFDGGTFVDGLLSR